MNEYWSVTELRTGRVICQCGDINDAIMLVQLDPGNRTYTRNRFLNDQIIDVVSTTDKQLPGQIGLPSSEVKQLTEDKIKLPESQAKPVIV